jgi:hypothetical protein
MTEVCKINEFEGLETVTREVEWEPQISFETFDHYPKINPKRHTNKSYKNTIHRELKDPRDVP